MPINFAQPNILQDIDPSYASMRDALMWLAKMGEGDNSVTPPPAGSLAGVKRINAGLIEEHNGTAWAEKAMGYLRKSTDTFTGTLTMSGNIVGPSSNSIKAFAADPLATIYTGGFAQFWGSAAASPGLVQIGNNTAQSVDFQPGGAVRLRVKAVGGIEAFAPTAAIPTVYAYQAAGASYGYWLEQSNSGADALYLANAQNTAGSEAGYAAAIGALSRGILYGTAADLDFYLRAEAMLKFQAGGGTTRGSVSNQGDWVLNASASSIGTTLTVYGNNPARGIVADFTNQAASPNGGLLKTTTSGVQDWCFGSAPTIDAFSIYRGRNPAANGTELLRLDAAGTLNLYQGNMALASATPTVRHMQAGNRISEFEFSANVATGHGQIALDLYNSSGANKRRMIECFQYNSNEVTTFLYSYNDAGGVNPRGFVSVQPSQVVLGGDALSCVYVNTARLAPVGDNLRALGSSTDRWSSVHAVNGTIQTSDESDKTDITPVDASLANRFVETLAADGVIAYRWMVGGNEVESVPDGEDITYVDDVELVPVETPNKQGRPVITMVETPVKREVRKPRFKTVTKPIPGKRRHWGFSAQRVKAAVDACEIDDFGGWVRDEQGKQHLRPDQFIPFLYVSTADLLRRVAQLEQRLEKK